MGSTREQAVPSGLDSDPRSSHESIASSTILKPLLQELRKKGFRYFAAETFSRRLDSTLEKQYAVRGTGTYTREPVFAEAVLEAIRLGYELVSYERTEPPAEVDESDPMFRQNHRELAQARNLQRRIFADDPSAKVLVWAGRSHVCEEPGEAPGFGTLKPMAYQFKRLTKIDPFSVYLPAGAEQATPEYEFSVYRFATHRGWIQKPTIFAKPDGETFGMSGDALVFFPRTRLRQGRPDWLSTQLRRETVAIPGELIVERGYQLVQAHHVQDFNDAVPLDQILIAPGDPVPVLMLPPGERYWVRSIDDQGSVRGPVELPQSR